MVTIILPFNEAQAAVVKEAARSGAWSITQPGFLERAGLTAEEAETALRTVLRRLP